MNTIEKLGLALVGGAMLYTAVAPRNQTAKVIGAVSSLWNTSLKTITGQA